MLTHPDADAFIRAILRDPAEVTTRLAFADWLEETGDPPNVAWAKFLRLVAEQARHQSGSIPHERIDRELSEVIPGIRARLTIDAAQLIGHVEVIGLPHE